MFNSIWFDTTTEEGRAEYVAYMTEKYPEMDQTQWIYRTPEGARSLNEFTGKNMQKRHPISIDNRESGIARVTPEREEQIKKMYNKK